MIHARSDYNRIQDPATDDPSLLSEGSTPIGEEEPVFLLRAQDRHFVPMLQHYLEIVATQDLREDEKALEIIKVLRPHLRRAIAWQTRNGCKTPDL